MRRAILVWIAITAVLASCTKDRTAPISCPPCPADISFKAVVIPIFQANCATPTCHDAQTHAFALNLDSANAYIDITEPGTGYVYANNAGNSLLYTILLDPGSNHMPLDAPNLPPCEIQDIECWINQGAQNN